MLLSRTFLYRFLCLIVLVPCFHNAFAADISNSKALLKAQLNKYQGQVIYLDFWASWCVPCRKSFPWMVEMQNKYKKDGFTVISINVDADKTLADSFLKTTPNNFPVIYDPQGDLAKEFKLKGMPSSYIFDRSGKIVKAHTGFFSHKKSEYEQELASLIFVPENTSRSIASN